MIAAQLLATAPAILGFSAPLLLRARRRLASWAVFFPVLLLAGLLLAAPARAEVGAADKAEIARVEALLEGISTLESHFLQIGPQGDITQGTLYLKRPGRIRFEYDAPNDNILVVADGLWLIFHDKEVGQVTRLPLGETPLGVLLSKKINLSGDVTVDHVEKQGGVLRVQLHDSDRPDEGSLTLVFSDKPLELRQWLITDPQGQITSVTLTERRYNATLDPKLFVFHDPVPEGLGR